MLQTSIEPSVSNEQYPIKPTLDRETQAKQWLAENREAIDAYKVKQAKQGQTFAELVGQV